jgi:hypothetical protein
MLFEGWPDSILPSSRARLAKAAGIAIATALLYVGLTAYAHAVGWTHAEPEEWIAYAGLNAIGAGVILHVAIGHRWPFASTGAGPARSGRSTSSKGQSRDPEQDRGGRDLSTPTPAARLRDVAHARRSLSGWPSAE